MALTSECIWRRQTADVVNVLKRKRSEREANAAALLGYTDILTCSVAWVPQAEEVQKGTHYHPQLKDKLQVLHRKKEPA